MVLVVLVGAFLVRECLGCVLGDSASDLVLRVGVVGKAGAVATAAGDIGVTGAVAIAETVTWGSWGTWYLVDVIERASVIVVVVGMNEVNVAGLGNVFVARKVGVRVGVDCRSHLGVRGIFFIFLCRICTGACTRILASKIVPLGLSRIWIFSVVLITCCCLITHW